MFRWCNSGRLSVHLSVIVSRLLLFLFTSFGFFINQFPQERIENFLHSVPYRCPLRMITGWKCAFCGMTHSWISLFRGEMMTAFHENLFGPLLWVGAIVFLVSLSLKKKLSLNLSSNPGPVSVISIEISLPSSMTLIVTPPE